MREDQRPRWNTKRNCVCVKEVPYLHQGSLHPPNLPPEPPAEKAWRPPKDTTGLGRSYCSSKDLSVVAPLLPQSQPGGGGPRSYTRL